MKQIANQTLTTAFVGSNSIFRKQENLQLLIEYTKGDETSLTLKIGFHEIETDNNSYFILSNESGEKTYTFTATGKYLISIPFELKFSRVFFKADGTPVAPGTVTIFFKE